MPKVSEAYKENRRTQILDAAQRCFVRDGFHRTSMQDILTEAGLSAGAVYRYFPSKDDIIVAIATRNLDHMVAVLRDAVGNRDSRGLGATMAGLLTAAQGEQDEHQLATVALMVWSEALRNPALADRLTATDTDLRGVLARLVAEQQKRGTLPADVPAETLAGVFVAVLPGFLLQLALFGPQAVDGLPSAVKTLWPT
ncbi:TetR/AcrR family transcriptional regulator [Streptomyces sp. NBC_01622]|uniref:TetR/AcrR family transcriptional regulator n=1 Tax=Streptomyces sp. NBC_01622 TaxID=2975903 RepID=UPI0038650BAC|nr:TetR/AcrR family transcriptional regulator [Streptomyces sp. NBC_01622]